MQPLNQPAEVQPVIPAWVADGGRPSSGGENGEGAWEGWTPSEKVSATKQNLKEDVNPAAARQGIKFITLKRFFRFIRES